MFHLIRRHPLSITADFKHCLVLTYSLPADVLRPQLPPGLELETLTTDGELGFLAIALVQTRHLRPAGTPRAFGQHFFLSGYRIFSRFRTRDGRWLRGLRIIRSDADRWQMVLAGNLLTRYNYCHSQAILKTNGDHLVIRTRTSRGEADLEVTADLSPSAARLPNDSCFATERDARRFAGPLPYTFDYEPETHSIIAIRGRRRNWHPRLVTATVRKVAFFDQPPFHGARPTLASAFYVNQIPYYWERGSRHPLTGRPEKRIR
jgi:hypothetical protein